MEKILRVIAGVVVALLGVWLNFLFMPAWSFASTGMWWFLFAMAIIGAIIFGVVEFWIDDGLSIMTIIMVGIATLSIVVLIIGGMVSSKMFNASAYQNLIDIEEGDFAADIPSVAQNTTVPIVDVGTARKIGDRTVGGIQNASWYEVDNEYNLIKYHGEYYRISELNYGGLFKYNKAKYFGVPGYVLVNVETQEATYVELEDSIKYSPSGHFGKLLKRHLRKEYPSYMFGKSFFEIDEEGNPYYITAVETPTIGLFGGKVQENVIITNAVTGENKLYTKNDVPEWVEHVYSVDYIMTVVKYNQSYVNGFWNNAFSQTGVNRTSYYFRDMEGTDPNFAGYNTVITAEGDVVFYTGVTPASNSESNLGFILANPRTGEVKYYPCIGAEEASAQIAAEGLVQNLRYEATFPTILNVDGEETYFMLMKDDAGLVQRYALCNVENYTKVVQAETFEKVLELYREEFQTKVPETNDVLSIEGTISKLYQAQINGYTYFYFTLEGCDDLYMSSIENSNKQVMLSEGILVKINFINSTEEGVYIVKKIDF